MTSNISGGPLISTRVGVDPDGVRHTWYELLGVVSWGRAQCEVSKTPGVYARVTSVLPWIRETIEGNGSISCPTIVERIKNFTV